MGRSAARFAHTGTFGRDFFGKAGPVNGFPYDREQRQDRISSGTLHGDFGVTSDAEPSRDDLGGECGGVAVAAEVTEDDAGQVRAGDFTDEIGGLFVGEMAVPVADALLGRPRTFGIVLEEDFVVVRFCKKGVNPIEPVDDHAGDVTDIAENAEAATAALEEKSDRIDRIVGDGKGIDFDSPDLEAAAGFELLPGYARLNALAHDRAGVGRGVDGEATLAAEDVDAAGVVAVFVGEDDGGEAVRIDPNFVETTAKLARRESRINEDAGIFVTNEGAIARAAAPENCQF